MRLVDADPLLKKTADLEAVALEQVAKSEPLSDIHPSEWHRWSGILQERTAFKYDLMDAPTIEAEPIRYGGWIWEESPTAYKCSRCNYRVYGCTLEIMEGDFKYCPHCGAKMDEEEK